MSPVRKMRVARASDATSHQHVQTLRYVLSNSMLPTFRGVNILSRIPRVFTMQHRFPKEKRVKINGVITDHVSILQSAGTVICKPIDFDIDLNN